MRRLTVLLLAAVAFAATFLAYINAASACYFMAYEPETPEVLRN